jgi:hypothetical protein
VADPWPLNERSVLYQWLSALVSRALAENVKVFLQGFFAGSFAAYPAVAGQPFTSR